VEKGETTVNRIKSFVPHFSSCRRNSSDKWIESIKAKIGKMQEYRQTEIKKIAELWNEVINLNAVPLQPTPLAKDLTQPNANLNLIENNSEEKYYGFAVRKTKIPPKTMQSSDLTNGHTRK
jgi:hypothetical protein